MAVGGGDRRCRRGAQVLAYAAIECPIAGRVAVGKTKGKLTARAARCGATFRSTA